MVTNKGALGAGASANAFEASAPMVMKLLIAVAAQNIRAQVCSKLPAYVLASVTLPLCLGDPLQTHLALRVPSSLMR